MKRRVLPRAARVAALFAALALCGAGAWFATSPQLEVMFARNLLWHRLESLAGAPAVRVLPPTGTLAGTVRDDRGQPVIGATVVAADASGRTYSTLSDAAGRYTLRLPPGETVPMATRAGYDDATLLWGPLRRSVTIADNSAAEGDFVLRRSAPRAARLEGEVRWGEDTHIHVEIPLAADV